MDLRCRPASIRGTRTSTSSRCWTSSARRGSNGRADENRAAWERGWQQNLDEARAGGFTPDALKPKYFRGNRFLRWQGDVVVSENPQIEYDLFVLARRLLFGSFLPGIHTIYEIGSGSGNNLWLLSELFPEARIVGLDWVAPAVQLATELGQVIGTADRRSALRHAQPGSGLHAGARRRRSSRSTRWSNWAIGTARCSTGWRPPDRRWCCTTSPFSSSTTAPTCSTTWPCGTPSAVEYLTGFWTEISARRRRRPPRGARRAQAGARRGLSRGVGRSSGGPHASGIVSMHGHGRSEASTGRAERAT